MKICLIGPSYPFRGGLAHHTTLLYRHLRRRHQVTFYAFRRQYPQWLFPGETDRDSSQAPLREAGVHTLLDSLNPLTWWEVARRVRREKPDLVIMPWWTSFWAPQFWTIAKWIRRASNTKILFICHHVIDHEAYVFSRLCTRAVLRQGDHFFVHSETDANKLFEMVPTGSVKQVFHPVYDFFNSTGLSKAEARQQLSLSGNVLLFFGFIRPYKGLDVLLEAMPRILAQQTVTLLVVGEFWEGRERYLSRITELGLETAIKVIEGYIPNEDVEQYFVAADLVVLPYKYAGGSGIVQIAYGFNKPVIATHVGGLLEAVDDGKTGYVVNPEDPQAFAEAVVRFFVEDKKSEFVAHVKRGKDRFAWEGLVDEIEALTVPAGQATGP